ncbi:ribosomal protection-like ABC-F family protein [Nocardiopsis sp. MG754419]|uniref:ribosomal protection-like ABC-F family protein n=1 Tax=Nocardiopsis sp. MG754419 TaxID=2259865 RepID=UPI001BAD63D0|nr:ABC-F family ATP-binding cassette domain-containing protein [Nocardiopsis sp. MG754419]MBR8741407.1 tylosin resistance protein TlrC [Nocardiopsis sp. MG754419]
MFGPRHRRQSRLTLEAITLRYGDHTVLDRVDLTIAPGERVGVIGDNGSGKSTLLRLIAGEERPDNGELTVRAPGGIGHLAQSLDAVPGGVPTGTVDDVIDTALRDLRDLERRIHSAEVALADADEREMDAYAALVARFEARGGYDADTRVDTGLHGLGLPGLDRDRPLVTLSGGERSRLALAATLASDPELLLLDEPTNDLDDRAVVWLEERLRRHRGTVVAVTHDRTFLARVTDTVLEVDADTRRIRRHGNGYHGYLAARAAARARWIREYEEWRQELSRQRRLVSGNARRLDAIPRRMAKAAFGHGAFRLRGAAHGTMGRIRNAKEREQRLLQHPVAPPPVPLRMTAEFAGGDGDAEGTAAVLDDVRVADRLHVPGLRIVRGERVLVTGPNGAGKSTLLGILAGELAPDTGTATVSGRVGLLRQEDPPPVAGHTVLGAYAAGRPGHAEEYRDELAALGLFRHGALDRPVAALSVGQRRRIEVARLTSGAHDLLLLDEPTNHLSPGLVEELEEALAHYAGTLVIVSHDRRTRERFTGRRLRLEQGRLVGDMSTNLFVDIPAST